MTTFTLRGLAWVRPDGTVDGPVDVAVRDGRIAALGRDLPIEPDAPDHDLAGRFLMPGAVDCHSHIGIGSLDLVAALNRPLSRWALDAAATARATLAGGVTLVRDACGIDAGIRDAIRDGVCQGPELLISVVLLSQTGGHGDGFLPGVGLELPAGLITPPFPGRPTYLVDSPDAMRVAVRQVLRAGADWIKVATTGGVSAPHDDPFAEELGLDAVRVAVEEAAIRKRHVMAHAMGGDGLDLAVEAGVRSIEHGVFLTEAQAARMAERGTWLVPTLAVVHDVMGLARAGALPDYAARKALAIEPLIGEAVRIARAAGVRIALGTDAFFASAHGRNLREIAFMHEAGLTPAEALVAATAGGAELCGAADRAGLLAVGRPFDAVVLGADPSDPAIFHDPAVVVEVFKSGVAVRGGLAAGR